MAQRKLIMNLDETITNQPAHRFGDSKKLNVHFTGIRGKIPWSDFSLGRNSQDFGFDPWNKIIRLSFHSNDPQIGIFSEPRIPNDSKSK